MAITISGENNNDRILASDGVIDQISGINIVGLITASHINVGSNIQLGNAGIITATTFVGNVTGNVNSTSPLLLQTGGSERIRLTSNNELGIAGANYGTSGQVLTSGGSGSAVTWSTIPTQVTISSNADNRVITGGSGTNLNGEANLTFSGNTLEVNNIIKLSDAGFLKFGVSNTAFVRGKDDTDGYLQLGTGGAERLRIDSSGRVMIGTTTEGFAEGDDLTINSADHGGITIRTPSNKEGNIAFSDTTSGTGEYSGLIRYRHSQNDLGLWTNSLLRLLITSAGKIGIGEAAPTNMLHVKAGDTGVSSFDARYHITVENNGEAYLGFYVPDNSFAGVRFNDTTGLEGYLDYYFNTDEMVYYSSGIHKWSTSGTERLRIKSNGQIVLGSDGSNSELTFSQDGSTGVILNSTTTGFGGYNTFTVNSAQFVHKYGGNERLRIDANGDINLGNNPTNQYGYKLNIQDNSILYAQTASSGGTELKLYLDHGNTIANFGTVTTSHLAFVTANTERLQVTSDGHVVPSTDSTYDLGLTGTRWRNVYGDTLYGGGVRITDDGSGSPLLSLRQDDQNPWAFIIGNDTYSSTSGLYGYVENAGDMLIRHRGNSEFKSLTIEQHNGSTNRSWLTLGNGGNVNLYYQGSRKFFTHNLGCTLESTGNTPELTFRGASNLDMGKIDVDQFATNYSMMRFFTLTNGTETEYARILDNGNFCVGGMIGSSNNNNIQSPGQGNGNTNIGSAMQVAGRFICNSSSSYSSFGRNSTGLVVSFTRQGGDQGGITVGVGYVSYGSGSDYRLKENVSPLTDGITRIKQLVPKRFNFIQDTTNTLRDGFLAHEVSSIVPEAITGTKDEVDSDDNPVYQQIDQAKLVPLLTAALQEAIAKIETLETKVAALEGS